MGSWGQKWKLCLQIKVGNRKRLLIVVTILQTFRPQKLMKEDLNKREDKTFQPHILDFTKNI